MDAAPQRLRLTFEDDDADRLLEDLPDLHRELRQLDVDRVDLERPEDPPGGAKAAEVFSISAIVVSLLTSSGALAAVVGAVQSWLLGAGPRKVRLELDGDVLELEGVSAAEQRRLTEAWLARQVSRGG